MLCMYAMYVCMYVQKEYPIELPTIGQYKHSVKWYPKQPDLAPKDFIL